MQVQEDTQASAAVRTRRSIFSSPQAGLAAAAALGVTLTATGRANAQPAYTDADIFNFALNFEYLGAEYYLRAVTGSGLATYNASLTSGAANGGAAGTVAGGMVTTPSGSTIVPFQDVAIAYFAQQLATDELAHVEFIRTVLGGAAVAEPAINFDAYTTIGALAGLGGSFNPFASEIDFLVGAYLLEDTCVTALTGAAALLTDKANLQYAAGLLGTESQQAGAIRGFLSQFGAGKATNAISALRAQLSQVGDEGTDAENNPYNISNGDINAQAYRRTPTQILAIAYGTVGVTKGGIFPNGVSYSNSLFASS